MRHGAPNLSGQGDGGRGAGGRRALSWAPGGGGGADGRRCGLHANAGPRPQVTNEELCQVHWSKLVHGHR